MIGNPYCFALASRPRCVLRMYSTMRILQGLGLEAPPAPGQVVRALTVYLIQHPP